MTQPSDKTAKRDDVETVVTTTARSDGGSVPRTAFDDPEEEAAYWRKQFRRERERLAKLLVAFKDLEAELELREEEADKIAQRKAAASMLETSRKAPSKAPDETAAASGSRTALETDTEPGTAAEATQDKSVSPGEGQEGARESHADEEAAVPSEVDPFGDIHPVIDVEGIGEVYTEALEDAGIKDSRRLWHADADEVAQALDVSPKVVRRWQNQAELMALDEVGPQYAELLVRSGITSIEALRDEEPGDLLAKIQKKQDDLEVRIQGNVQSERRVQRWIEAAKRHDW